MTRRTTSMKATPAAPKRSLSQCVESGEITVYSGPTVLWQGMPSGLASRPDLVSKVWPTRPDVLRRAVQAARCISSAKRGRQRGCTPRQAQYSEPLPEHAYLGTPVYRVSYLKDGKEWGAPSFALRANAMRAKELLRAKYGQAYVGR